MKKSFIVITILAMLGLSGCLQDEEKKGSSARQQMPPPTVSTSKISLQDIEIDYIYPARLDNTHEVQLVSKVSGILEVQNFSEGDKVKKGDLLYEINDDKYRAIYTQAVANESVTKATLDSVTRTWERTKLLFESDAISKQEYDNALGDFEGAKASLSAAKAAVKVAKVDLDDTKIYAPIDGVAGQTNIDVGNYISLANTKLVTITKLNPINAEFSLPDRDFEDLRKSLEEISIFLDNPNGELLKGKVSFKDPIVNRKTSTIKFKGLFPNDDNLLMPGMFTRIHIKGATLHDAIVIPQKALLQDPSGTYVYLLRDGKADKTPVRIGRTIDGNFIIESGLEGNETIIMDNLTKLRQGMPVKTAKG